MWLQVLLAALGIIYETIRCILCQATATRKKNTPAPSGWTPCGNRWMCPGCSERADGKTGLEYPTI